MFLALADQMVGLNALLDGFSTRSAHALCTIAYSPGPNPDNPKNEPEVFIFEGRTGGTIVPPRGPSQFGWDPIFEVQGVGQTYVAGSNSWFTLTSRCSYAEMDSVEKNKISHRYKAVNALREYLLEHAPQ